MRRLPDTQQGVIEAARIVNAGGLVAFPTETFYGLAADPTNGQALARLFEVKERPAQKAILVLVADRAQLLGLVKEIRPAHERLMDHFWPGPLTLIFEAKEGLQPLLTAGTGTIGVRISSHSLAKRLVRAVGGPITATSANLSGLPAAVSSDEVERQLDGRIDAVLDGGKTSGAGSSTIACLQGERLVLVREGVLAFDELLARLD